MEKLTDLPNIGRVLAGNLERIGVVSPELLRQIGAREAFLRIRAEVDSGACLHQLEALEGAVNGVKKKPASGTGQGGIKGVVSRALRRAICFE